MYISFPISRDPPEGGTEIRFCQRRLSRLLWFPISRDPPEGGTHPKSQYAMQSNAVSNF